MGTKTAHSPIEQTEDDQPGDEPKQKQLRSARKRQRIEELYDEDLTFAVCELFCNQGITAPTIAKMLSEQLQRKIRREHIYPMVNRGRKKAFYVMRPPLERYLQAQLADRFGLDLARVTVAKAGIADPLHQVANIAAEQIELTIRTLAKNKETVHLGLDAGWTTRLVAEALARLLSYDPLRSLKLHLLSPGHPLEPPATTPAGFVDFFRHAAHRVEHVEFHAQPWASTEERERIKTSVHGAREAFEQASEIDVIVTSIASAADKDCRFRRLLEKCDPQAIGRLEKAKWKGDIGYRPYNAEGPIIGEPQKLPVSLLDIPDYVEFAANDKEADESNGRHERHSFLVVGPCADCGGCRSDALLPLLVNPKLRVFNHLVTDVATARGVLP